MMKALAIAILSLAVFASGPGVVPVRGSPGEGEALPPQARGQTPIPVPPAPPSEPGDPHHRLKAATRELAWRSAKAVLAVISAPICDHPTNHWFYLSARMVEFDVDSHGLALTVTVIHHDLALARRSFARLEKVAAKIDQVLADQVPPGGGTGDGSRCVHEAWDKVKESMAGVRALLQAPPPPAPPSAGR
ncbi:MAG: hypothetical protein HY815_23120 [Candidatus Riflebacteria bacterium]|nr:hypothetical protein [Candidatus Riflebacteria bacterium]